MRGCVENAEKGDLIAATHQHMRFANRRIAEQEAPITRGQIAPIVALDEIGPKIGINSILGSGNLQVAVHNRPPIFRMWRELLRVGRRRHET